MFTKIFLVTVADMLPLAPGRGSWGFMGIPCVWVDPACAPLDTIPGYWEGSDLGVTVEGGWVGESKG